MTTNNFFIVSNETDKSKQISNQIKTKLLNNQYIYDSKNPNYTFSIGGDGTLLKTYRLFNQLNTNIIMINTGNIGFYSYFNNDQFETINQYNQFVNFNSINCSFNNESFSSINEFVLTSLSNISFDIYINENKFESFSGTGIIFSTSQGSTGINKSAGGSIIFQSNNLWQMTFIAPLQQVTNTVINNSIVFNNDIKITLKNINSKQKTFLLIDGFEKEINFMQQNEITFFCMKTKPKFYWIENHSKKINKLYNTFIKGT